MEKKITHMEFIQNTIKRMAHNSFALKGWAVTLIAGVFVLASKEADKGYFLIAYLPVITFWILDSYYLKQEKLFRALYDKVRNTEEEKIDFNMSTKEVESDEINIKRCFISITEGLFYFPLFLVVTVLVVLDFLIF